MNRSEFDRRADQISKQLDDIRGRLGDLASSYQSLIERGRDQIGTAAVQAKSQARSRVEDARSAVANVGEKGVPIQVPENMTVNLPPVNLPTAMPWWVPVAALVAVITAVLVGRQIFSSGNDDIGRFINDATTPIGRSSGPDMPSEQNRWS